MKVIVCYEEDNYKDIIWIPDCVKDIEYEQKNFFRWMFDKSHEHKYWVYNKKNEKIGCSYGTDAFIEYLNKFALKNVSEKSKIIKQNIMYTDRKYKTIYF